MLKQELLELIEKKRSELILIATKNGLSSSIAIKYSQELDHLLNEYDKRFLKKVQVQHF
ncbi:Spo0E family sporulation regulatory protein-aspartic acid phosphatase [Neobacillus terrae]|uniref:Spo0E family sporulation regulatory protein-aspartic acid phosphatase n=1 Tax=Neobacillus terrae TaxID=3034837 RepID=UPI001409E064|nr:aspartyl-phosphate phosphatase Spo0E family protein [Neobacillus terrae]